MVQLARLRCGCLSFPSCDFVIAVLLPVCGMQVMKKTAGNYPAPLEILEVGATPWKTVSHILNDGSSLVVLIDVLKFTLGFGTQLFQ